MLKEYFCTEFSQNIFTYSHVLTKLSQILSMEISSRSKPVNGLIVFLPSTPAAGDPRIQPNSINSVFIHPSIFSSTSTNNTVPSFVLTCPDSSMVSSLLPHSDKHFVSRYAVQPPEDYGMTDSKKY